MNGSSVLFSIRRRARWLGLLVVMTSPTAGAITQEIRALFVPDSAKPYKNEFVNKTLVTGYCSEYPTECQGQNMFSIRLPVKFNASGPILPFNPPARGATFKVPSDWRRLTVRNVLTEKTETVEVRITGIGSQYLLSDSAANLVGVSDHLLGHQKLWNTSSWVYAAPPCVYSGVGAYGPDYYRFFWKTPKESACTKTAQFLIPHMSYEYLDFAYELRTPNPLGMSSGLYTGDLTYRIGPGGDFDMGEVMVPDDNLLTLNFVLDVQHTLKVDIPPGGDRVFLEPVGGWQSWLQSGRRPVSLIRDQTFSISSSTHFKMQLMCQQSSFLYDCQIHDPVAKRSVELQVRVTLPNGLTTLDGQPVSRLRLRAGADKAEQFQPGNYVDRKPGFLHFEVPPHQMQFMIQSGVQSTYSGYVTVIWDSDI